MPSVFHLFSARVVLVSILVTSTVWGADELAATMRIGNVDMFVIKDTDNHHVSRWLKLGESFGDLRLLSYDFQHQDLLVEQAAKKFHLYLKDGTTLNGNFPEPKHEQLYSLIEGSVEKKGPRLVFTEDAVVRVGNLLIRASRGNLYIDSDSPTLIHGEISATTERTTFTIGNGVLNMKSHTIRGKVSYLPQAPSK